MRKLQAGLDSNRWDRRAQRPTVAWPSEAVRVGDVAITFFQKRVEAPYYGRETGRSPILPPRNGSKPHLTVEDALPALRVKRNRLSTIHNAMMESDSKPYFDASGGPLAMISDRHCA